MKKRKGFTPNELKVITVFIKAHHENWEPTHTNVKKISGVAGSSVSDCVLSLHKKKYLKKKDNYYILNIEHPFLKNYIKERYGEAEENIKIWRYLGITVLILLIAIISFNFKGMTGEIEPNETNNTILKIPFEKDLSHFVASPSEEVCFYRCLNETNQTENNSFCGLRCNYLR